jgi:hypothetical protein
MNRWHPVALSAAFLLCGCHEQTPPARADDSPRRDASCPDYCPAEPLASIHITATDAITGKEVCGFTAVVADEKGQKVQLLHYAAPGEPPCAYFIEEEREATFTINVRKKGYESASGRTVQRAVDCCYFSAPNVRFLLEPEAAATNSGR